MACNNAPTSAPHGCKYLLHGLRRNGDKTHTPGVGVICVLRDTALSLFYFLYRGKELHDVIVFNKL